VHDVYVVHARVLCRLTELCWAVCGRMEGGELFDQIAQRGSFTEYEAYQVMTQVAEGLQHLHKHGYMHRDLKVH
jgi:serine/threonine protein kinase